MILSKRDVAIKCDKVAKRGKVDLEEGRPQCSKMTNVKTLAERRRTLLHPTSSSEEENAKLEMSVEVSARSQVDITIHMPVRTSRILLVRFLSNQSANIFLEVLHFSHITRIDRPLHSLILLRTLTSLHHWIVQ